MTSKNLFFDVTENCICKFMSTVTTYTQDLCKLKPDKNPNISGRRAQSVALLTIVNFQEREKKQNSFP